MKYASSKFRIHRTLVLGLLSFAAVAALLVLAVSAKRGREAASLSANITSPTTNSVPDAALTNAQGKKPLAPQAAVIVATLTDNVTAATKIAPGANINYTATITNNGAASPADDATNLNFSAPLDANTTLVAGSVHASPIARNDTYNWVGNTQLDTVARALPAVTANDVAVNATGGTDTFTVTAIAGGATALGGTVTLASPSGAFTYTPPLGRPNIADGASVNDSFTYTITNSADPSLTSTGTVTIALSGRVWYLQAGAAGDGRSNTPSSSPSAMSTAADKSTDVFYIFSNGASLNGPFSVDAGQQLLGQGVNLVVSSITLFTATAPTPTTTNTAGNCVALAGAPGNNTVSGFNIGNCTGGTAITGANVGTLNVSTMTINTNGGALDLTGVGAPTVSVVLGGTTSTGGARNVSLVGLNGTVTLAGGALSGSTGNGLHVDGGNAGITFTGTIQNTGARQVNIINKTGGTVALSGAIGGTGTGIFLNANNGATLNFSGGIALSTGANAAFTATGPGPAATSGGTVNVTQNNTTIVNTLASTTGTGLNVANTTIGASGLTFRSIASNGAANGILLNNTGSGGLTVTGNGGTCTAATPTCTGGRIQSTVGADGATGGIGVSLQSAQNVSLTRMRIDNHPNFAIRGTTVTGFTLDTSLVDGTNGTAAGAFDEAAISFNDLLGSVSITDSNITNGFEYIFKVLNSSATPLNRLTITNCDFGTNNNGLGGDALQIAASNNATVNVTVTNSRFTNAREDLFNAVVTQTADMDLVFRNNTLSNNHGNKVSAASNMLLFSTSNGGVTYDVSHNALTTGATGSSLAAAKGVPDTGSGGTMVGTINSNTIGTSGVVGSGSQFTGIFVSALGSGTHTTAVTNNTVLRYNEEGIFLKSNDSLTGGNAVLNATVTGNITSEPDSLAFAGLWVLAGSGSGTETHTVNVVLGNITATPVAGTPPGTGSVQNDFTLGDPANGTDVFLQEAGSASVINLSRAGSAAGTATVVVQDDNVGSPTVGSGGTINLVNTLPPTPPPVAPIPNPADESVSNPKDEGLNGPTSTIAVAGIEAEFVNSLAPQIAPVVASVAPNRTDYRTTIGNLMHHGISMMTDVAYTVDSLITPTAYAQDSVPNAPTSGETVTLNTIATFPAGGKSITIKYSATVNAPPLARQVSTQGTVTANGGISVVTDDPEPAGGPQATVTLVDTLMTWNGATSTDWNTATNWTQPAGGTQYAPGVSNPAINDVVIPNVGNQPNISATDIGVFSLNISNGRTLTITSPRVLTIGGSPGGDLTLDGIISGGSLNLGTGTHVINNAGGTGSLSSTNMATVLSGGTVTLNNNLQAGALGVNAGGSMNITNRTLSLNGTLGLVIAGGVTFTTTGSTVIFNGTAVQQAAGIAYNNLTINNTTGLNVTGVTLIGNATVNGTLTLTSSDLATGAFTLTQPNTTASTGVSDVVGTVSRTGGPFAIGTPLTFGNPNNILTITAGATRPTAVTFGIAKAAPINPNGYAAAVQRTYTISQTGGTGFTSTLRLHYLDSELNGNTEASLNLRRLRTSDNHWTVHLPTTLDAANNWVQSTGVLDTELSTRWTMSSLAPTAANGMVTGRITDAQGRPVEGAVVRLSGAQDRKFITDANGNYRFDNVETGEFYTVTPSRANFNFNPFNRSFSQSGNQTNAVFTAESMGDGANPLDTAEYFVRQQYVDVLGREPDEAGFNYWSDKILGCGEDAQCVNTQRREVAAAFFIAEENQASGVFIYDAYAGALGRRPAFAEFTVDRTHVVGGATLDADKTAFAQSFVQRAEFMTKYQNASSADAFVDALLQSVQATGADLSSERSNLIGIYGQGADQISSRAAVLRSIADNATFKQSQYNPAFVLTEYFAYLRRDAEPDGFTFWVNVLSNGDVGNYRGMVCSFVTSREYQNRFSQIVSHSNGECSMP